jgi:hypothetical protein
MKLIFFIILLIFLIILLNKEKFIEEDWYVPIDSNVINISKQLYNDKWKDYRIGDVYHLDDKYYDLKFHENILYHEKDYPGSIASEYIKLNKPRKRKNFSLLKKIINSNNHLQLQLNENDLVLHIRVGDIMCGKYGDNIVPWSTLNTYKTYYSKIGNDNWWNEVLNYIKKKNIKRVFILAGLHTDECLIDSARYLENRRIFLNNNGIEVIYRLGQSPDEDLIFASKSKHFISTGGGYGELLKEVNKNINDELIKNIIEKIYNGDNLDGYRLADCIMYPDYLTRKNTMDTTLHLLYKYPNTICDTYIKSKFPTFNNIKSELDADDFKNNYKYDNFKNYINNNIKNIKIDTILLNEIIKLKSEKYRIPTIDKEDLVLHIRIGDIICNKKYSQGVSQYSKKGNDNWWNEVLNYIKKNNIKRVFILAGSHFKECLDESARYLENRRIFLNNNGIEVIYRLGNTPDEDLIFASKANHFITTGGGYGFFIGNIVKQNGGNFSLHDPENGGLRLDLNVFSN